MESPALPFPVSYQNYLSLRRAIDCIPDVRADFNPELLFDRFVESLEKIPDIDQIFARLLNSSLMKNEVQIHTATHVTTYFFCFQQLYSMMGFRWGKHIWVACFIYLDRFLKATTQTLDYQSLWNYLVIISMIAVKFWGEDDSYVDCNLFSFTTGLDVSHVQALEIEVLTALEFRLNLKKADIQSFLLSKLSSRGALGTPSAN